jgi:hypothetical protein
MEWLISNGKHDHVSQQKDIQITSFHSNVKNRVVRETIPIAKTYEEQVIKVDLSSNALASLPLTREIHQFTSFIFVDV